MHLFYTPDINGTLYTLSEEESKHCIRVLRLTAGDVIQLMDGKGNWYEAEITDDNAKRCSVKVIATRAESKKEYALHVAIAPTKNMDRLEWFIEKATETGIDEISLIDCKTGERSIVKHDRLVKVAVSAAKQSLKAWLPQMNELLPFKKFIEQHNSFAGEKFIAHCHSRDQLPHLKNLYTPQQNALVLIGPEGDFSAEEIQLATGKGFKEISLGNSRLRTETAALYACTAVNILNEK